MRGTSPRPSLLIAPNVIVFERLGPISRAGRIFRADPADPEAAGNLLGL